MAGWLPAMFGVYSSDLQMHGVVWFILFSVTIFGINLTRNFCVQKKYENIQARFSHAQAGRLDLATLVPKLVRLFM